jgi:tripartite-type tricarboxylate transporter receptor subunit TctC
MNFSVKVVLLFIFVLLNFDTYAFDPTSKPINVIIPFPPGGSVDASFGHLQKYAFDRKITLIPIYKPGAEGIIGTRELVKSPTDGYTIGLSVSAIMGLYKYQNKILDLTILTGLRNNIMVIVINPEKISYDLSQIDYIARSSTNINFGYGSPSHKSIFQQYFKFVNAKSGQSLIPYKGGAKVISDLVGGHIDVGVIPLILIKSQIDSGTLKIVAIAADSDYSEYPDVPRLNKIYSGWKNFDGVLAIAPKNINSDAKLFWDKFLKDYLNDKLVQSDIIKQSTSPMKFGPEYIIERINNNFNSFTESEKND